MYFPVSSACTQPNSATPMTAARINVQALRVSRMGRHFTSGNTVLNDLMAKLTPPVARPSCGDLQSSFGLRSSSPFPDPGGGPSPTVNLMTPAQLSAWYAAWAKSSAAAAAAANDGALVMPIIGGPAPGVSSAAPGAPVGYASGLGSPAEASGCTDPEVLPLETVGRSDATGARAVTTVPAAASVAAGVSPWLWATLALVGIGIYAVSGSKGNSRA